MTPIIDYLPLKLSLQSSIVNAASPSMATLVTNASSRQPTVTPAVSSLSLPTNGRELNIAMISQQILKTPKKI